jgi:transcriptional regulator with XRE-family HTH domain
MVRPQQFGARLVLLREHQKLSPTRLAALAGIDFMQIHRYEKGKTLPTLDSAARIAKALQISLDELANGTEPPAPPTFRNERLLEQMKKLDQLPPDRQEMAMRVLDTVITGYELEALSERLKRK